MVDLDRERGKERVEMVVRHGLPLAGSFFQKLESHKITYTSGQHKTELDLLIVRKQQLWRIWDCKVVVGEHVTTQHKPVGFLFVVCIQKRRKPKECGLEDNQVVGGQR